MSSSQNCLKTKYAVDYICQSQASEKTANGHLFTAQSIHTLKINECTMKVEFHCTKLKSLTWHFILCCIYNTFQSD